VRKALATLPWVKDIQVNFDTKQATFSAEAGKLDEAAIKKALEAGGFEGKLKK
jgi:copper chaperone CopZ